MASNGADASNAFDKLMDAQGRINEYSAKLKSAQADKAKYRKIVSDAMKGPMRMPRKKKDAPEAKWVGDIKTRVTEDEAPALIDARTNKGGD